MSIWTVDCPCQRGKLAIEIDDLGREAKYFACSACQQQYRVGLLIQPVQNQGLQLGSGIAPAQIMAFALSLFVQPVPTIGPTNGVGHQLPDQQGLSS